MTETVQFEFNACPAMLTLSAWSARRLELDEIIMDPERDPRLRGILGEGTWERLARKLAATSPEQPEMRMDIPLRYPEGIRWSRVVMRSLWSDAMVPGLEGSIGIVIDIHDTRQRLQELEEKASLDALTGLLNRSSAREQIEVRLQSGSPLRFALALFDLDFFKSANDTCGHQFGDEVLKFVARRLRSSVRGSDICCRAGGDEFLLFLEYKTDIERTVERIFRSICGEYGGFRVSVTIGVALEDTAGRCYENLFRQADAALYSAKRAGRGRFCFYENSMENLLPAVES